MLWRDMKETLIFSVIFVFVLIIGEYLCPHPEKLAPYTISVLCGSVVGIGYFMGMRNERLK